MCRKFDIIVGGFFRGLGRPSHEVHVGTTDKENQWNRKCHIDFQGRHIKNTSGRTKGHQREILLVCPLGHQTRKAYIMMGVPSCVTQKLLHRDKDELEASRMTKWNTEKQKSEPTNMVNVLLVGSQHPVRFTRGYGIFRMRPFVREPLKCLN